MNLENEKRLAAIEAVNYVKEGMIVGLGSGSTSGYMIEELGKRVSDGLKIKGVPSSEVIKQLAEKLGIPIIALDQVERIDINIDGADEFDPKLRLIKGGGGALLREKIVAHNANYNIVMVDSSKEVDRLGKFKLPIETVPFATQSIFKELENLGLSPKLRQKDGSTYKTDQNNDILDLDIFDSPDLEGIDQMLQHIPGIVETGLFLNSTDLVILGKGESTRKIYKKDLGLK